MLPRAAGCGHYKVRGAKARPQRTRLALECLEARDCPSSGDWSMYGHDPLGSRNNTKEHTLGADNVSQLGVAWSFPTAAPVTGTPAVVGDVVYAGDFAGSFYALDADNGTLQWQVNLGASVSASALITDHTVVVGDLAGNVWGLNAKTGATRWRVHPNNSGPLTNVYGSATMVGDKVAIGFSSNEELTPGFEPFQARGSVALIDPNDGHVLWQTYTIPEAAYDAGWRGASVWSTPTYDKESHLLYVTTGNYFEAGTGADPGVEDGVIALDARTGAVVWTNQLVFGDVWNIDIVPGPNNPDSDIGDSAKIFTLPNGRKAVSVGSKNGNYFVLDALTGAPINGPSGLKLESGGVLGGLFATGAVDLETGIVFQNGLDWPDLATDPNNPFPPPTGGDLYAVSLDGKTLLWDFKTPGPNGSGVAIANGVVYFQSLDGTLYALDASAPDAAHALLATFQTGGNYSGPAVSGGHVYLGTGAAVPVAPFTQYHNSIVCLGLPPKHVDDLQGDLSGMAGALQTVALQAGSGQQSPSQIYHQVDNLVRLSEKVIADLAAVINVREPSLNGLKQDLRAVSRFATIRV